MWLDLFFLRRLRKTPLFLIENMKKTTLSFYSVEISGRWLHCSYYPQLSLTFTGSTFFKSTVEDIRHGHEDFGAHGKVDF